MKSLVLRVQFGKAGDRDGRFSGGDDLLNLGDLFVNQGIQCCEPLFQVAASAADLVFGLPDFSLDVINIDRPGRCVPSCPLLPGACPGPW